MAHHTQITVRWSELDPYQHVNHAVYLTYLEAARIEALAELGFGIDRLADEDCQIVLTDMQIKFLRSAVAGDILDISTSVIKIRRASTQWLQTISIGETQYIHAILTGTITDFEGRPRRLPEGFAQALEPVTLTERKNR
jgi:acyl-CoA thioester hydrolase